MHIETWIDLQSQRYLGRWVAELTLFLGCFRRDTQGIQAAAIFRDNYRAIIT